MILDELGVLHVTLEMSKKGNRDHTHTLLPLSFQYSRVFDEGRVELGWNRPADIHGSVRESIGHHILGRSCIAKDS